jgi:CxxC-x17-CxxC domain-containing protein
MCTACRKEEYGRSWRDLRAEAQRKDWPIVCAKCGADDTVPFKPLPDREFLCKACHAKSSDEEGEEEIPRKSPRGRRVLIE